MSEMGGWNFKIDPAEAIRKLRECGLDLFVGGDGMVHGRFREKGLQGKPCSGSHRLEAGFWELFSKHRPEEFPERGRKQRRMTMGTRRPGEASLLPARDREQSDPGRGTLPSSVTVRPPASRWPSPGALGPSEEFPGRSHVGPTEGPPDPLGGQGRPLRPGGPAPGSQWPS